MHIVSIKVNFRYKLVGKKTYVHIMEQVLKAISR